MKTLLLTLTLVTGPLAFANEGELYSDIHNEVVDQAPGQKLTTPICFEQSWTQYGERVKQTLEEAKTAAPGAFVKIPGYESYICIEPTLLVPEHFAKLDRFFDSISAASNQKITVPVLQAAAIPTPRPGFNPNYNPAVSPIFNPTLNTSFQTSERLRPDGTRLLRNEGRSYWHMAGRAELFITPFHIVNMAMLLGRPPEETHWARDPLKDAFKNLGWAWTHLPVIDHDNNETNYVDHPLAGMVYFSNMRSQGGTFWQSFLFAAMASATWEFGWEATVEKPSIQDLIATPVLGSLAGETVHFATMAMRKNGFNTFEKIVVTVINPFYVINNGYKTKPRHHY